MFSFLMILQSGNVSCNDFKRSESDSEMMISQLFLLLGIDEKTLTGLISIINKEKQIISEIMR